jgi:hypothetical protein
MSLAVAEKAAVRAFSLDPISFIGERVNYD